MISESLNGKMCCPFPYFVAHAVFVPRPITQVNFTHVCLIVFNNQTVYSFPTFPDITFVAEMRILVRT
jgi:hypothetical protein